MAVSLSKGANVSLSKLAPNLTSVLLGLGWEARVTDGTDFDLDASAFMLTADGKVRNEKDFVYYNNLTSPEGAITHTGDNLTGEGEGDDETIIVGLGTVPADIVKIMFTVTIHDALARKQSFGQVSGAFIRVVDNVTKVEIARYDLTEDASAETAMIFGELYRHNGEWKFRAVGQGHSGGLAAVCSLYGVQAA